MIELNNYLDIDAAVINAANITHLFDDQDLTTIGGWIVDGYKADKTSRGEWEKRMESALDLALQLQKDKTFPWAGCSNVKFPLVTIAAMQWHSRAYPLLIQGPDVVKCRVIGRDPDGEKRNRADRVSSYMSYQVIEEDPSWEEESDRLLLQVPILGCGFKKTYFDPSKGRNVSEVVSAKDLVLNYYAKSVEECERKTHITPLTRNDLHEGIESEIFRDIREEGWFTGNAPPPTGTMSTAASDLRRGMRPPQSDETTPYVGLEQHVRLDLDGDGYAEPWIVTVEEKSGEVIRITSGFKEKDILKAGNGNVVRIHSQEYFTKFSFIPSPDGGIYDLGFGILLGPINEAVNSVLNQLIDAGTLETTAGGFLGRGVKIRGGEYSFRPFGWQRVDSTGEDLSKGIFPLPVRTPSAVLLQLLTLLIEYANRIGSSTDIMVGENPGQNTPAQTSQLMAEQGSKINTAIFKRIWRSFKNEFQKLYMLNREFTPVSVTNYGESSGWITREDFSGPEEAIRPAADPNLASDSQRANQAMMLVQRAGSTAGYDKDAVEKNLLRALRVENAEALFKGSKEIPAGPPLKLAIQQSKDAEAAKRDAQKHKEKREEMLAQLIADAPKHKAEIEYIEAQIAEILSSIGAQEGAQKVKEFEAQLNAAKAVDESARGFAELLQKQQEQENEQRQQGGGPGMAKPSGNASAAAGAAK